MLPLSFCVKHTTFTTSIFPLNSTTLLKQKLLPFMILLTKIITIVLVFLLIKVVYKPNVSSKKDKLIFWTNC